MRTSNFVKAFVGTALLSVTTFAQTEIVYNNTSTPLTGPSNENLVINSIFEIGDNVTLDGQNRLLSRFEFEYSALLTPAADKIGVARIYANDGVGGAPLTLLYESDPFLLDNGLKSVSIDGISGVTLPDSITWSFGASPLGAGEASGLLLYNPPTVGSSDSAYWEKTAVGWVSKVLDVPGQTVPANFSARITAVPEPTTIQLAILGGLAVLGLRSYRRRS
jgi:hypothetical protein